MTTPILAGVRSTLTLDQSIDTDQSDNFYFLKSTADTAFAFNALIKAFILNTTLGVPQVPILTRDLERIIGDERTWDDDRRAMLFGSAGRTRIQKVEGGYKVGLRINHFYVIPNTYYIEYSTGKKWGLLTVEERANWEVDVRKRLTSTFGDTLIDNASVLDITVPAAKIIKSSPWCDLKNIMQHDSYEGDFPDYDRIFKSVTSIRFISPALPMKVFIGSDTGKAQYATTLAETTDEIRPAFIKSVLESRQLIAYVTLFIPDSEAVYMTQTPAEEIKPTYLAQWAAQWFTYQDSNNNSECIKPIRKIEEANNIALRSVKNVRKRVNEDNLLMDPDGNVIYIPTVNNISKYEQQLLEFGTTESGEFVLSDDKVDKAAKKVKLPANMALYTDWVNNKFVYTNTSGYETFSDLERCVPVTISHVNLLLTARLDNSDTLISALHQSFDKLTKVWFKQEFEAHKADYTSGIIDGDYRGTRAIEAVLDGNLREAVNYAAMYFNHVVSYNVSITENGQELPVSTKYPWMHNFTRLADFKVKDLATISEVPLLRIFGAAIHALGKIIEDKLEEVLSTRSVLNGLIEIGLIKVLDKHIDHSDAVHTADEQRRANYINPDLTSSYSGKDIGLVRGLMLQPHQDRSFRYQKNMPSNIILSTAAGGGKTIQILLQILYGLNKKVYRRPLIMCPAFLVKDYIKEANFVTSGRLNVIAVTSSSLANYGEEKMAAMIEQAPTNTVVVTDYNFIKGNMEDVVYGNAWLQIGRNAEFLRQFDWDIVALDESHWLKNESQRTLSVQRLISEIPNKILASGTFVHDMLTDVVMQFNLIDPSVFGSRERFASEFAAETRGNKIIPKPGAEKEVMDRMRANCNVVICKRKEWAALLPEVEENFYFVDLTLNQRSVYEAVLQETIELIKADNPELLKQLNTGDESEAESIESMLNPYLARLEQFLTAPASDKAGEQLLVDDDAISPKSKRVAEIIKQHLAADIPGKILIFTSYKESARVIFDSLPKDLQARAIHYTAERKFECAEQFERDANKVIMIGVEKSMNTGLNLQFASRLIRIESVWSPGDLEQGQSRINRPMLKGKDKRTRIYFDWVVANRTIDITKIGRLIAKMVSNAKFENSDSIPYLDLKVPELLPMNLTTIMSHNDFQSTLATHLTAFQAYKQVEQSDYDTYRNDPKTPKEFVKLEDGAIPQGSALMKQVPYVAGMDLYGAEDLGLVRYFEYLRQKNDDKLDPKGLQIHTEWGDGECVGAYKKTLRVELPDGSKVSVDKMAAFVITKTSVSTSDIRKQLLKLAGLDVAKDIKPPKKVAEDAPFKVIDGIKVYKRGDGSYLVTDDKYSYNCYANELVKGANKWVAVNTEDTKDSSAPLATSKATVLQAVEMIKAKYKKPIKVKKPAGPAPTQDTEENDAVDLYLSVMNESLCALVDIEDPDANIGKLKPYGFKKWTGPYLWAYVKTAKHMMALWQAFEDKYMIPASLSNSLSDVYEAFNVGKSKLLNPDQASQLELRNFYRLKMKAAGTKELRPYPLIQDGELYIMLDLTQQPAAAKVPSRIVVPGVKWVREEGFYAAFFTSKAEFKDTLADMQRGGITINNLPDVKEEYKSLTLRKKST